MYLVVSYLKCKTRWHGVALVLFVLVSLVYGMHHIALSRQSGEYHPMVVNEDEAMFTGPKAHAAEMGEIIVGDFNVAEYKDTHMYVLPFLSPLIMGNLARAVGGIERAFIVADFLFPPIIFLLFYAFLEIVSRRRMLAVFGATLFIFIPQLLLAMPPITRYLQAMILTLLTKGSSLYFSRVEDPQLTVPLYLAALIFFLLIFKERKEKWVIAGASIFYGLLFYSYFYYWMYTSMALAIATMLTWRSMPDVRKHLTLAMGLGLVLSIPHWINASLVSSLPQYPDLFDRLRPEVGRAFNFESLPIFAYLLHAVLIAAVWRLMRKDHPETATFLTAFLLAIFPAYNIQVLTGFNVHPDHWYKAAMPIVNAAMLMALYHAFRKWRHLLTVRILVLPWALLAAFLFYKITKTEVTMVRDASWIVLAVTTLGLLWLAGAEKYAILRSRRFAVAITVFTIVLLFGKAILIQRTFIGINATKTLPLEESASYEWLTANMPAYSVIATPSFTTSSRLQLYTRSRLFLPNGYNTIAGDEELFTRLRLTHTLFGTSEQTYRSILEGSTDLGGGGEDNTAIDNHYFAFKPTLDHLAVYYLFHMHYLDSSPGSNFQSTSPVALPADIVVREMKKYQEARTTPLASLPYRLDYLYYGPRERILVPDASALAGFKKIYDESGVTIYTYRHE